MRPRVVAVHKALWSLGADVVDLIVGLAFSSHVERQGTAWRSVDASRESFFCWSISLDPRVGKGTPSPEVLVVSESARLSFDSESNSLLLAPRTSSVQLKGTETTMTSQRLPAHTPDHLVLCVQEHDPDRDWRAEHSDPIFITGREIWKCSREQPSGQWKVTLKTPHASSPTIWMPLGFKWHLVGLASDAGVYTSVAYAFHFVRHTLHRLQVHLMRWTRSTEQRVLGLGDVVLWSAELDVPLDLWARETIVAADPRRGFLYVCCGLQSPYVPNVARYTCPHAGCAYVSHPIEHGKHFLRIHVLSLASGHLLSSLDIRMDGSLESAAVASESGVLWIAQNLGKGLFSVATFE